MNVAWLGDGVIDICTGFGLDPTVMADPLKRMVERFTGTLQRRQRLAYQRKKDIAAARDALQTQLAATQTQLVDSQSSLRSELLTTPTTPRTIPRPEQLGTKRRKIVEAPLPPLLQPTQPQPQPRDVQLRNERSMLISLMHGPNRNHIAHERIIEIDRLLHEHSQN